MNKYFREEKNLISMFIPYQDPIFNVRIWIRLFLNTDPYPTKKFGSKTGPKPWFYPIELMKGVVAN